ncbi:MCP four helix bundle domain-containing protein [Carboxylicivirga caseinilyticus]|uniref:MCP four helix bundle domain-containing protein n=1 Tax=Carboxylicivirga caseinilyticus TaxID=3417572 RepID=UPI003D3258F1|nr:MCP four helix bundle domain-containing protein [Marinilabiliaceae bacterium A049]
MSLYKKIKWIASVLLIFIIVLTTNLIDRDNYNRLRDSVTTIYEDRIVASDFIFELSMLVQEKKTAYITNDTLYLKRNNVRINHKITEILVKYELTKLTISEQKLFGQLKSEFENLKYLEKNNKVLDHIKLFESIDTISQYLFDLSKVQLNEGKRQMIMSNKTMDAINIFTRLEIIFLVFLAILIQIIIIYNPKNNED